MNVLLCAFNDVSIVFKYAEICYALTTLRAPGGGVLPYVGYIGMCRCEGYGFQAVYSRIGYINQSVWV